ncbi:MAG TPA: class I SAM-dependent methyltransferase [Chthoniobacterales bacterium]|nr:class I SAM-dependent methyltransferase [Chthoniobacterales bacterium]
MQFKDHFSKQAADYAKFRPRYPREMFEYLGTITPTRQLAWDCATGNGQAAFERANVFDRVVATDASESQIANAEPHEKVEYRTAPAEQSGLESAKFDLVLVAQGLHWLNRDRFYPEVRRVLGKSGLFAASAYNLLQTERSIKDIVGHYYYEIVGPYWPPERALIEQFPQIPFPFPERKTPQFKIAAEWNLEHLVGYLRSWSSTQRFIAATNRNPLDQIARDLQKAWGDPQQTRRIVWPLILRVATKVTLPCS